MLTLRYLDAIGQEVTSCPSLQRPTDPNTRKDGKPVPALIMREEFTVEETDHLCANYPRFFGACHAELLSPDVKFVIVEGTLQDGAAYRQKYLVSAFALCKMPLVGLPGTPIAGQMFDNVQLLPVNPWTRQPVVFFRDVLPDSIGFEEARALIRGMVAVRKINLPLYVKDGFAILCSALDVAQLVKVSDKMERAKRTGARR